MFFKKKVEEKNLNKVRMEIDGILSDVILRSFQLAIRFTGESKEKWAYGIVVSDTPVYHEHLNVTINPGDKVEFTQCDAILNEIYIKYVGDIRHVIYPVK